jgi:hypothetical protein
LEVFDAESFVADIAKTIQERLGKDLMLDMDNYMVNFLKSNGSLNAVEIARDICTKILTLEFSQKIRPEYLSDKH